MRKPRSSSDRTGNTRRPLERIYRIHEVVKRGKYPNCRSLAETLEVTQKTVQRDISFMRDELDVYRDILLGQHDPDDMTDRIVRIGVERHGGPPAHDVTHLSGRLSRTPAS